MGNNECPRCSNEMCLSFNNFNIQEWMCPYCGDEILCKTNNSIERIIKKVHKVIKKTLRVSVEIEKIGKNIEGYPFRIAINTPCCGRVVCKSCFISTEIAKEEETILKVLIGAITQEVEKHTKEIKGEIDENKV